MIFFVKIEIIFKMGAFFGFENETFFGMKVQIIRMKEHIWASKKEDFLREDLKNFKLAMKIMRLFYVQFSHFFVDD